MRRLYCRSRGEAIRIARTLNSDPETPRRHYARRLATTWYVLMGELKPTSEEN